MSSLLSASDTLYAFRFLRLLTMEWQETEAFKTGVIDGNGKLIARGSLSKEQKEAYTIFHRLVFNIKRLLPASKVATYASALFLIREYTNLRHDDIMLMIKELGVDTSAPIKESMYVRNDRLLPGEYQLKESIASIRTGETIARKGTKIVTEGADPVDCIAGINIYKVKHKNTNQEIYISQEDITR